MFSEGQGSQNSNFSPQSPEFYTAMKPKHPPNQRQPNPFTYYTVDSKKRPTHFDDESTPARQTVGLNWNQEDQSYFKRVGSTCGSLSGGVEEASFPEQRGFQKQKYATMGYFPEYQESWYGRPPHNHTEVPEMRYLAQSNQIYPNLHPTSSTFNRHPMLSNQLFLPSPSLYPQQRLTCPSATTPSPLHQVDYLTSMFEYVRLQPASMNFENLKGDQSSYNFHSQM